MNCPHCQTEHPNIKHTCRHCNTTYRVDDVVELRQVEFLLNETANWAEAVAHRQPYLDKWTALKAKIIIPPSPPPPQVTALQPASPKPTPTPAPQPKPDPVPFDQWLLSERNIKIALYLGGLLLLLAGLIFVGINWTYFSAPIKFIITDIAGYMMLQRKALKIGGLALVGLASGFVPLNFVVLQIYMLAPLGIRNAQMLFAGSFFSMLAYLITLYLVRHDLFTYLSMGALFSAATAAAMMAHLPLNSYVLIYSIVIFIFLLTARLVNQNRSHNFISMPLLIVAHITAPTLFSAGAVWWSTIKACADCSHDPSFLSLAAMIMIVLFYVITDIAFRWELARWASAFAFTLTMIFGLIEINVPSVLNGLILMALALTYLIVGYALKNFEKKLSAALPLYLAGYGVAAFVTLQAMSTAFLNGPDDLAKVLIGDVILLVVSAIVHRQYVWLYGATTLFIVPTFIYAHLFLPDAVSQGILLGALMVMYVVAAFAGSVRTTQLSDPFLAAAALLSSIVTILTWKNPITVTATLSVIIILYVAVALWRKWSWLLLPALGFVNLAVFTVLQILFWSLYLVALFDLGTTYLLALFISPSLAATLSMIFAVIALGMSWVERDLFTQSKLPPALTYLALALIFIGHIYLIHLFKGWNNWTVYTATLCAIFVNASWLLRRDSLKTIYGTPLHITGLLLNIAPALYAVVISNRLLGALTFVIVASILLADAIANRNRHLVYLSAGAALGVLWSLLAFYKITEVQAYVIPLGLGLAALGWIEKRNSPELYLLATIIGLAILMCSAFAQSLQSAWYALLLLVEGVAALAWGTTTKSRGYVQLGVLSLVANALAQFGPAFADLPRWIQLGSIGVILFGGGILALFQRERILVARNALLTEWKRWEV
ncbi:MAG: hypothetical protein HZC38_13735 [Chloroflexi bacterium]|nr:hypothetical protein [Chloroflexota bacterium]